MDGQKPREIASEVLNRVKVRDVRPEHPKEDLAAKEAALTAAAPHIGSVQTYEGAFVEEILDEVLAKASLTPANRGLCQELVYGVVRWRRTLDWLIERKSKRVLPRERLLNILRLGLYQIFWLDRIPNHAAVNETVELAKQSGFHKQAGFVNATLRGYLREFELTKGLLSELKTNQPDVGFSHPEWLVARWVQCWDKQKAAALMEWNNTPPKIFARVNLLRSEPGKLLMQWRNEGVEYDFLRRDWLEENLIFELKSHPSLRTLPSFQQGLFYVQDPSTLLAVTSLDSKQGQTVLDLCAAPGGKLTYIAQLMRNEGRLVAHDVSTERLKLVQENCSRLGVTCVEVVSTIPARTQLFDKILIDAPCSNTGVMRRRVDLRWRIRPNEIQRLRGIQLQLLRQAAPLLKPGGVLVYSTCSLEPEENGEVVQQFLREHNEFNLEQERKLLPFIDAVDGAYVARLTRGG